MPLSLVNRSGHRPSHEGAAERFDQAIALCREAGFRKILLRGDTDCSSTRHLDRWRQAGVGFLFGIDAMLNLVKIAAGQSGRAWERLQRPVKYEVKREPRSRPENIKEQVVVERGYRNLRLDSEDVAEFDYLPGACRRPYRMVVVHKNLSVEAGGRGSGLVRRRPVLLLPDQRRGHRGRWVGVLGQRSLRPGEANRPAQETAWTRCGCR